MAWCLILIWRKFSIIIISTFFPLYLSFPSSIPVYTCDRHFVFVTFLEYSFPFFSFSQSLIFLLFSFWGFCLDILMLRVSFLSCVLTNKPIKIILQFCYSLFVIISRISLWYFKDFYLSAYITICSYLLSTLSIVTLSILILNPLQCLAPMLASASSNCVLRFLACIVISS